MGIFKKPKTPKPPEPVQLPAPPSPVDPAVLEAGRSYRKRVGALARPTLFTPLSGLEEATTAPKTLLGA